MNMNKKFLKHYMETEPEGTAQKYIFLVDNQEIALNIIISGYQSLYLVQEEEDGYYSIDGFSMKCVRCSFREAVKAPITMWQPVQSNG